MYRIPRRFVYFALKITLGMSCPLKCTPDYPLTLDITPGFILLFMADAIHIGKAAKLAGVSVDTIRF